MADKITIKFKGVPEALSSIKKWEEKKLAQVSDDLKTTAFKIEGAAKRNGAGQWIDLIYLLYKPGPGLEVI